MAREEWDADTAVAWMRLARSGCVWAAQHEFLRKMDHGGLSELMSSQVQKEISRFSHDNSLLSSLLGRDSHSWVDKPYTARPRGTKDALRRLKTRGGASITAGDG